MAHLSLDVGPSILNDTTIYQNLFPDYEVNTSATTDNQFSLDADEAHYSSTAGTIRLLESLSSLVVAAAAVTTTSSAIENGSDYGELSKSTTIWDPCDTENPLFNCSVLEFLEYYQGPQMMPFLKAIMVSNKPFPVPVEEF